MASIKKGAWLGTLEKHLPKSNHNTIYHRYFTLPRGHCRQCGVVLLKHECSACFAHQGTGRAA